MNITKQFESAPITFNDDGWFNATEAAKAFDKRPNDWLALPSTIEYVGALRESDAGKSGIALVVTKKGGRAGAQGTWLHPKLGVAFARWLDVRFAVWCDTQIDGIIHGRQSIRAERASLRVEYRPMTDAVVRSGQTRSIWMMACHLTTGKKSSPACTSADTARPSPKSN